MNDGIIKLKAILTVVVLSLFTTYVEAGLRYTTDIEIVDRGETTHQVEVITLDGDRARIEYFAGEQARGQPVVIMLTVDAGKTWALLEGDKAECGKWDLEADPIKMAQKMIAHIDAKRKALGIDKARERVLMDMADRQALEA